MSLRLKMTLGIGGILLLVIAVFVVLASRSQMRHRLALAEHEANLIAAVADRALSRAMGLGETDVVQAILARIGEHPSLAGIRIVNAEGKILRSSLAEEIGKNLPLGQHPRSSVGGRPVHEDQGRVVGVFRPIVNGPSCAGCHAGALPILGFLNARVHVATADAGGDRQWTLVVLTGVAGLLTAGGLIWLLFTVVVGRRLNLLAQTMRQVEGGGLPAPVSDRRRDELGQLAASFNAMVTRLADARRQLEDRHAEAIRRAENLASLGKMAAGIAHEINNPLAGMQNCVRSLLKSTATEERRVQYLEMLREGLERVGRTVGELLNFARTSAPKLADIPLPVLLQRGLRLLEYDLAARGIAPNLDLDADVPVLRVDPQQMEQVLLNVLKNALEAMPQGGDLSIRAGLERRESGSVVRISVVDTGLGIASADLPRIFDPFFTTKDVGKGTGLGLSVSYGIIRAHGGVIDVQSVLGKGTNVTISLPTGGG
jgi:two-component system NtrC family sensor kinase